MYGKIAVYYTNTDEKIEDTYKWGMSESLNVAV